MAEAAKLALQYPVHGKMLCCLLFDIEDVGMTIVAVEPLRVYFVREYSPGMLGHSASRRSGLMIATSEGGLMVR